MYSQQFTPEKYLVIDTNVFIRIYNVRNNLQWFDSFINETTRILYENSVALCLTNRIIEEVRKLLGPEVSDMFANRRENEVNWEVRNVSEDQKYSEVLQHR